MDGRRFPVKVRRRSDGQVLVTCDAPTCMARGPSEAEALERIRDEIRYRLEWCPCSGLTEEYVQLEVQHSG